MRKSVAVLFSLLALVLAVAIAGAEPATPAVTFCVDASFEGGGRFEDISLTVDGRAYGSQGSTDANKGDFFTDSVDSLDGTYCLDNPLYEGEYDFYCRSADTLLVKVTETIQFGGVDSVNCGELQEGDADGNNAVAFNDFNLLSTQYNTAGPAADFDENNSVGFNDFTLLSGNYNLTGATAPSRSAALAATTRAPGTATVRLERVGATSDVVSGGTVQYRVFIDNPNAELMRSAQFQIDYNENYLDYQALLTGFGCFAAPPNNQACDFDLNTPANDTGSVVTIAASKGGGDALTKSSIFAGVLQFSAIATCQAPGCGAPGVVLIGGEAAQESGTIYGTDNRAIFEFANCPIGGQCANTDSGLAVALSSFGTQQAASAWVAVLAVMALLALTTGYTVRQRAVALRR